MNAPYPQYTLIFCLIFSLNQLFLHAFFIVSHYFLIWSWKVTLFILHHPAPILLQDDIHTSFLLERCGFGCNLGARLQLQLKLKYSSGASSEMWAEHRAIMSGVARSRPEPRTANVLRLLEGKPTCWSKKIQASGSMNVGGNQCKSSLHCML